jgi:hypothetical protein
VRGVKREYVDDKNEDKGMDESGRMLGRGAIRGEIRRKDLRLESGRVEPRIRELENWE